MVDVATAVLDIPAGQPADVAVNDGPSGLSVISSGKIVKPRRALFYGVHGIGKTTLAASAPAPIFLPTEEGANDIDCDKFPLSQSWEQFEGYLKALATESHRYETVVVDSLDWLERLIWKAVCQSKSVETIEDISYGKGYVSASEWWSQLLKALTYLRSKGMTVVLLAHAKIERFENPEDENYNRYTLSLHKTAAAMVQEWCDEVLFANYKVYTKSSEEGFGKTTTKAIGGDERILRTQEKPFCQAKNRLGMPGEIPLKWSEYSKYFPKG